MIDLRDLKPQNRERIDAFKSVSDITQNSPLVSNSNPPKAKYTNLVQMETFGKLIFSNIMHFDLILTNNYRHASRDCFRES